MITFTKMHGLGNDFVVLDGRDGGLPPLRWAAIANRHFGVGCDQVVVLEPSRIADLFMRIYNSDGGEVESCGNASRCVAWLLKGERQGIRAQAFIRIETLAGVIEAEVIDCEHITVDMGQPYLQWHDIPLAEPADTLHLDIALGNLTDPAAVSMGNPHMVFFVPDLDAIALHDYGPRLEQHPLYPLRGNVSVAQILSPEHIRLRVWERGAGLTLACGTGACAALVAAHRRGLTGRKAQVTLPGGDLTIEWRAEDDHVMMTGPATVSFQGRFPPELFA